MKKRLGLLLILVLLGVALYAQTDTHDITISVPEIALIDLDDDTEMTLVVSGSTAGASLQGDTDQREVIYTCLAAVALGACALEKHFTVSRDWPGPDVPISIEPDELEDLIKGSAAVFEARGGHKDILPEEQPVIDFAYASVVSIEPIKSGEEFTLKNV